MVGAVKDREWGGREGPQASPLVLPRRTGATVIISDADPVAGLIGAQRLATLLAARKGTRPGPAARSFALCHPGIMQAVPAPDGSCLLACGRVVTPRGVLSPGWIRLTGNGIHYVGGGP